MNYDEARRRLRNHGNLSGEALPADTSLMVALGDTGALDGEHIAALADDVVSCLAFVNLELNGPTPSESNRRQRPEAIEDLSPAVSGILAAGIGRCAMFAHGSNAAANPCSSVLLPLWRVALAWSFVLDGDEDDLVGAVQGEVDAAC